MSRTPLNYIDGPMEEDYLDSDFPDPADYRDLQYPYPRKDIDGLPQ